MLRRRRRSTRKLKFEGLQQRRLLAADVGLTEGVLHINGGDADDNAEVWLEGDQVVVGSYSMSSDGSSVISQNSFAAGDVQSILFNGGAGNDVFTNSTGLVSVAAGGAGNDSLVGGSADDVLIGEGGNDLLYGREGNDVLLGGSGSNALIQGASATPADDAEVADQLVDDNSDEELCSGSVESVDETPTEVADESATDALGPDASDPISEDADQSLETDVVDAPPVDESLVDASEDESTDLDPTETFPDEAPSPGDVVVSEGDTPDDGTGCDVVDAELPEEIPAETTVEGDVTEPGGIEVATEAVTGEVDDSPVIVVEEAGNDETPVELGVIVGDDIADTTDSNDDQADTLPAGDEAEALETTEMVDDGPVGVAIESNNDRIFGGAGDDWIFGQSGDDVLFGDDLDSVLTTEFLSDLLLTSGSGAA